MKNTKPYSQFRAMLSISKASFRSTLRSPSSVAFGILFPLVFIIAFGYIGSGGMHIEVATVPGIHKDNPIYAALKKTSAIRLHEDKTVKEISEALGKGKLDASLNIIQKPDIAHPAYVVEVKTTSASAEKGGFFQMIVDQVVDKINLAEAHVANPVAEIKTTVVEGRKFTMIDFILPGQLGFAVLSTGVFATAFVFLSLRQTLVIKRFFATPIKRIYIVLGEALSRLVFSLIGSLVIILIGHYAFNFTLVNGFVTVVNMLLLCALGLVVFMGFGFIISGVARNEATVPPLANIITLPQFILSGTFFSIEEFPEWLQHISKALPLTYLNDALRKVAFEGASLAGVSTEIFVLLAWGAVAYIAAAKAFRWE